MVDQSGLGVDHHARDVVLLERGAARETPVPDHQAVIVDAELGAVLDPLEDLRADFVEQDDAGGHQHLGTRFG